MFRILAGIWALFVVFTWACGSGRSGSPSPTAIPEASPTPALACGQARPHAAGSADQTITSGGLRRTYVLYVPPGYDGAAAVPLVVSFHGYSLNSGFFAPYANFDAVAQRAGFVVVTPDGTGSPQFWNAAAYAAAPDDVAFVKDLLAQLEADLCIDAGRVYLAGYSNGGGMALRASCELPDRIAAVGVVAATYVNCRAAVPLIAFHGTADPMVPYEGGSNPPEQGGNFPPVRRTVSEWAVGLGCDTLALISRPSSEVEVSTFPRCASGTEDVLLYTILGGGHAWPGATPLPAEILGATTQQVNASQVMWEFFSAHPKDR
jgi:polyhydroxybutyrate depolymerase